MRLGLQLPRFLWSGGSAEIGTHLRDIAETADGLGFASIWLMDHLFQAEGHLGRADDPMLEGYTTLAFIAATTKRASLGTLVTAATYRPPGLLVKMATTLDVLSQGRAWLGLGAGWYAREAAGLGLPFPSLKERFERLEETLQIATQMWKSDTRPFHGRHYHLSEPINQPQAVSKPRPSILVGGAGERKTLLLAAKYADACNLRPNGTDYLMHKLDVLKRHCAAIGRDYASIQKTLLVPVDQPGALVTSALLARCQEWARLGIDHVILSDVPAVETLKPVETLGRELLPAVAAL